MNSRLLAAATAAFTALSGLVIAASPAAAAPSHAELEVSTSNATVHTSNGKAWTFNFSTFQEGKHADLTAEITRVTRPGTENHSWDVPITRSVITFNAKTGHGTVKTPQGTAPLITLNLGFTTTSRHKVKCASGSETNYGGNLSGQATLNTHLKGGGTVGGKHVSFKAGGTVLTVDNGCVQSFPQNNQCEKSVFLDGGSGHNSVFGFAGGASRILEISHNVAIAHPAGATRSDSASVRPGSAPVFKRATKTVLVSSTKTGLVTGSGRIVAKSQSQSSGTCRLNGNKHTRVQYLSNNGHFTNTTGHPLVGHTILTGRITLANGGSASYDVVTWH